MRRKFLTNLILLLSLNLLVKPFWIFGIDREVQNIVGSESYGFYFAVLNFTIIFNILLDFGITNFNNRNIAQNNQLLNKHFSSIVILRLILAVVYTVFIFLIAWAWGYGARHFQFLGILAFNQFLLSFILYLRSNVSGLLLFKTDSVLSVLDRFLMIIICGVLIWSPDLRTRFKIEWFVYAQTVAYFITALIALSIVVKKAKFRRLKWNLPFFVLIMKQSFPFAVLILLMSVYNRVDAVILEGILPDPVGDEQAGIYAHAYRLLDAFNQMALLFTVLLLPIFSRMIKIKENVEHVVKLAFTILFTIAVIVACASCLFNYEIMDLLYDDEITQSAKVFGILLFGFIPISTTYVFGTLLTANGSLKQLNIIAASGMVINLLLNFMLIPKFLALGSAVASLSTQSITAIAQVIIACILFRFRINYKFISALIIFVIMVFAFGILSTRLPFDWFYNLGIMVVASLIAAFVMRLLNISEFVEIIKER